MMINDHKNKCVISNHKKNKFFWKEILSLKIEKRSDQWSQKINLMMKNHHKKCDFKSQKRDEWLKLT